jgi:hypothetical protein
MPAGRINGYARSVRIHQLRTDLEVGEGWVVVFVRFDGSHLDVLETGLVLRNGVLEAALHQAGGVRKIVRHLRKLDHAVVGGRERASLTGVEQALKMLEHRGLEVLPSKARTRRRSRVGSAFETPQERYRRHGRSS